MTTIAFFSGNGSSLVAHEHVQSLLDYISGDLDKHSLNLLENICHKSPKALDKLLIKFKKKAITIKATDFNLVAKAILMQANLSEEIIPTIHSHLIDGKVNSLAKILNMLTQSLLNELPASDPLRSTMHVMDNLGIFDDPAPEEQFIKSIMLLMLNFHIKQNTATPSNYQDSAKWLKSLLAISQKSSLIHLVDYIAIRLHIAGTTIHGAKHHIELTDLFSTVDDLAKSLELSTCKKLNHRLIKNISACTLVGIICKNNPLAIVDVVDSEISDTDVSILHNLDRYYPQTSVLDEFIQSENFKEYYKKHPQLPNYNHYTFLTQFTNLIHEQLTSGMKPINPVLKNFIINCVNALDSLSEPELVYYLADIVIPDEVINIFCNEFLTHICQHSQSKHFDSNHLEYCANKLVNFGFAPRSTVYTEVGAFQPLVCKNKSQLDKQNNYALTRYIHALDAGKRSELIKELMVALLIRYRIKPHVLQNQPKPIHRRAIDSNYPVPTTHKHTTKEKESPLKNFNTAQNMYQLTFFARKYAKENSKPEFTPQTEGKQYGG